MCDGVRGGAERKGRGYEGGGKEEVKEGEDW